MGTRRLPDPKARALDEIVVPAVEAGAGGEVASDVASLPVVRPGRTLGLAMLLVTIGLARLVRARRGNQGQGAAASHASTLAKSPSGVS